MFQCVFESYIHFSNYAENFVQRFSIFIVMKQGETPLPINQKQFKLTVKRAIKLCMAEIKKVTLLIWVSEIFMTNG